MIEIHRSMITAAALNGELDNVAYKIMWYLVSHTAGMPNVPAKY
jgi:hypothetical protein